MRKPVLERSLKSTSSRKDLDKAMEHIQRRLKDYYRVIRLESRNALKDKGLAAPGGWNKRYKKASHFDLTGATSDHGAGAGRPTRGLVKRARRNIAKLEGNLERIQRIQSANYYRAVNEGKKGGKPRSKRTSDIYKRKVGWRHNHLQVRSMLSKRGGLGHKIGQLTLERDALLKKVSQYNQRKRKGTVKYETAKKRIMEFRDQFRAAGDEISRLVGTTNRSASGRARLIKEAGDFYRKGLHKERLGHLKTMRLRQKPVVTKTRKRAAHRMKASEAGWHPHGGPFRKSNHHGYGHSVQQSRDLF